MFSIFKMGHFGEGRWASSDRAGGPGPVLEATNPVLAIQLACCVLTSLEGLESLEGGFCCILALCCVMLFPVPFKLYTTPVRRSAFL